MTAHLGARDDQWRRWVAVVLFAVAMAWMESATVVYLRTLVGRLEPYQVNPLPIDPHLSSIEMWREFATMVMLGAAGWLAGRTRTQRLGYWMLAFGVWDILYYAFLAVMGPWPRSLADWDILFLLPLPWWGPVYAPCLIALSMALLGTLLARAPVAGEGTQPTRRGWAFCAAGALLALAVFMADALLVAARHPGDTQALAAILPARFGWEAFLPAVALLNVPALELLLSGKVPRGGNQY